MLGYPGQAHYWLRKEAVRVPNGISSKLEQIVKEIKPSAKFNLSADLRKDFGLD